MIAPDSGTMHRQRRHAQPGGAGPLAPGIPAQTIGVKSTNRKLQGTQRMHRKPACLSGTRRCIAFGRGRPAAAGWLPGTS